MIQVLPAVQKRPSFMQKLGVGLGGALEEGEKLLENYQEKATQKKENDYLSQLLGSDVSGLSPEMKKALVTSSLQGKNAMQLEQFRKAGQKENAMELEQFKQSAKDSRIQQQQQFLEKIYGKGATQGREFAETIRGESPAATPLNSQAKQDQHAASEPKFKVENLSDSDIAMATAVDPNLGRLLQSQKDVALRENREQEKARTKKEAAYFSFNEPELKKVAADERKLDMENLRFDRLSNLFSDRAKFPSSGLAAIFSKEGQINDLAYSQLSPEAQEAIKIIYDFTQGAKDSYGARITNFELGTYLKRLPSLLMSPEGRERVIRDLKTMNEISQVHNRGVQQVFDEAGGSDKISFSEAEKRYKKKYGALEKKLSEDFVEPEKKTYNEMPDAKKFLGKKLRNKETGEVLISDGNDWKPVGG